MIKAEVNKMGCLVEIEGSTMELIAESQHLLNQIYETIKEDNNECANLYKEMMIKNIDFAFMSEEQKENKLLDVLEEVLGFSKSSPEDNKPDFDDDLINELRELKRKEME